MRKLLHLSIAAATGLALAGCLLPIGCDDNSNVLTEGNNPVFRIMPDQVAFNLWAPANQSPVALSVDGGTPPFSWSVSNTTLGTLSVTNLSEERTVVYTPKAGAEGLNIIAITDENGWVAHAQVLQDTFSISIVGAAAATPDTITITDAGGTADIVVSGGLTPMVWTVGNSTLGKVGATSGRNSQYTRNGTKEGVNTVQVRDSRGMEVTATIAQHN